MARITLTVQLLVEDMDVLDTFMVQLRHTDKILSAVKGSRDISKYDLFYDSCPIYPEDTPLSLHMQLFDTVDAYKIATKEEAKDLVNHLKECKYDPSRFKMYCGGDIAICDMARLPIPAPSQPKQIPKQPTHKWGKGRRLGKY